jgi:hypothetical protein
LPTWAEVPAEVSWLAFVTHGVSTAVYRHQARVRLHMSAEQAAEWVFGCEFDVIEPPALADAVRALAHRLQRGASGRPT